MGIRTAIIGVFLSCYGYNVSVLKNHCKNTVNLIPDLKEYMNVSKHNFYCEKCSSIMDDYFIDNHRKLYICIHNPLCDRYILEYGVFLINENGVSVMQYEKCRSGMFLKVGRFGRYMLCRNLHCKNTQKVSLNICMISFTFLLVPFPELLCKESDAYFVLPDRKSGIFFLINTFLSLKRLVHL